jgi:modification methylase
LYSPIELRNKLLTGDVLEHLNQFPDSFIDVSVTSPPYNKQENKKGWLVKNVKYSHSTDARPEEDYQQWQIDVLNEVFRVTKPGGSFFYNHKIRWELGEMIHPYSWISKSRWKIRQEIIWDRQIAANLRGWRFWQVEERIFWLQKPRNGDSLLGEELESRHAKLCSIWRFTPERDNPHPSPFPLELPLRAIYSVLDEEKGIVLDPFCGSGTTLVAAKALGCPYIGIDISPEYIAMAEQRLENIQGEMIKIKDEMAKHIVQLSFKDRKDLGYYDERLGKKSNSDQSSLFEIDCDRIK